MKAAEVDEYIKSGESVSVWIKPHSWSSKKREVEAVALERKGRTVTVRVLRQEVPNEVRSGEVTLYERVQDVSTNAIWSDWSAVVERRQREASEREARSQKFMVEYAAEKAAKRAEIAEWAEPLRGIMIRRDVDTLNWPRGRWDDHEVDLTDLLIDAFEDTTTMTMREEFFRRIADHIKSLQEVPA